LFRIFCFLMAIKSGWSCQYSCASCQ